MSEFISPQAVHWIDHLDPVEYNDLSLIKQACLFASTYENNNTPFSLSTLTQGIAMSNALLPLHCDSETLAAAIIYPAIFFDRSRLTIAHAHLNKSVIKIIDGALQMESIHALPIDKARQTAQQNQVDNLRKMMLSMVDDVRTVLLKLSERLVMLQHINRLSKEEQRKIAQETLDYYAPLANRLGIHHLKWQLEDWAFRYVNPNEYRHIANAFHVRHKDRVRLIHEMITELKLMLKKCGIESPKISGRIKHIYSIHQKIERKKVPIEQIYDTSAIRILVPTIMDCYAALSMVHATWTPISSEFDDYIAKPKLNGYQSIHTAIIRPNGTHVEIQCRTFDMHEKSELGIAAHWRYKENVGTSSNDDQKIILLRELLDWQKLIEKKDHSTLYHAAFHDRVYVFSPAGDIYDLQNGATPLDFAYLIHSELGHRCRGAKVNGTLIPLTQALKTGDRIDIITTQKSQPSHDWIQSDLGYLKTMHAVRKVRQWFKKQNYEKNHAHGMVLLEKTIHQYKLHKTELQALAESFYLKTIDAFFAALGAGDITVTAILNKLALSKKEKITEDEKPRIEIDSSKLASSTADFSVHGAKNLLTQVAQCCHPIPGDDIIGYITQGRGITVHQKKCRNIRLHLQNKSERLMSIIWEMNSEKTYRMSLQIQAGDRAGLLHDISGLITKLNLSIFFMQSRVDKATGIANIQMIIDVKNVQSLEMILRKLRQIKGVTMVLRK